MIKSPKSSQSPAFPPPSVSPFDDDDDGWQDMPVVRSDGMQLGLDDEDAKRYHYKPPARLDPNDPVVTGNATGTTVKLDADVTTDSVWRDKLQQDESDYTRLRLMEDEDSEEVHMRTKYLFDEEKAMTPLTQMQATKELLTEGQRIAYVGLCALVARGMLVDMGRGLVAPKSGKGKGKLGGDGGVVENGKLWMLRIMARLYQHMELEVAEQRMIESLAEHGVDPTDLVPALQTTHKIKNPEYDPEEARRQEEAAAEAIASKEREAAEEAENARLAAPEDVPPPPYAEDDKEEILADSNPSRPSPYKRPSFGTRKSSSSSSHSRTTPTRRSSNPFGEDEEEHPAPPLFKHQTAPSIRERAEKALGVSPSRSRSGSIAKPAAPVDDDDGDIGGMGGGEEDITETLKEEKEEQVERPPDDEEEEVAVTPKAGAKSLPGTATPKKEGKELEGELEGQKGDSMALPGVTTSLSKTEEEVTLDIRWTVLCDLFLVLIADSVYDSRSRVFLEQVAVRLGLTWLDVTRFEKRVTDALEIQEGVEKLEQDEVIEGRRQAGKKKRYAMMGLATLGGGLVIGLSAGLLAPVIGAGLGAAFATVGITGTTGFLAGAGGAAVITTGGVLTGSTIGGKGMARRTREVRTFEFRPLHNNKRVNCFITVPGFMASTVDDVRLPFSTLDPIVGDVFSVLWEPEMMNEMGNALRILTTEVLTQVGQTVLQATVMTALMSALQWPLILTKLGYLIDNPWSNALDRSYAAGLVLADTLINRHAGVRPISLIGFSLGARAIFYALAELAKRKAFGIVQDVYLFGTTVTASRSAWLDVSSVVAGKLVNGYATSDWVLGYLFRATSGGLNTVAGLRPVENVPGLENVDVTEFIAGHMSYRSCMPVLLEQVGLPITADWFDEPEDPNLDMSVQERTIISIEEQEAALARKNKIWGIFPRRNVKATPAMVGPTTTLPPSFTEGGKKGDIEEYDEEEDDGTGDIGAAASGVSKKLAVGESLSPTSSSPSTLPTIPAPLPPTNESTSSLPPSTAGFDFRAISSILGKDVDPTTAPAAWPSVESQAAAAPAATGLGVGGLGLAGGEGLERSGSAPPLEQAFMPTSSKFERSVSSSEYARDSSSSAFAASTSRSPFGEEEGDIGSWDRPTPKRAPTSSSFSSLPPGESKRTTGMGVLEMDDGWGAPAAPVRKTTGGSATEVTLGGGQDEEGDIGGFGGGGGSKGKKDLWGSQGKTGGGGGLRMDNPW